MDGLSSNSACWTGIKKRKKKKKGRKEKKKERKEKKIKKMLTIHATKIVVTMATRHMGSVEFFSQSPEANAQRYIKCRHQYTVIILSHASHHSLLRPFHVAAGSANCSYSNLPSVSSTSFSSLYCSYYYSFTYHTYTAAGNGCHQLTGTLSHLTKTFTTHQSSTKMSQMQ